MVVNARGIQQLRNMLNMKGCGTRVVIFPTFYIRYYYRRELDAHQQQQTSFKSLMQMTNIVLYNIVW